MAKDLLAENGSEVELIEETDKIIIQPKKHIQSGCQIHAVDDAFRCNTFPADYKRDRRRLFVHHEFHDPAMSGIDFWHTHETLHYSKVS
jgi:hypothetical protein